MDDFDDGTWKYFAFSEQSLVALHRKLGEETRRGGDFVLCRRRAAPPRPLFPVVLDLPPGNADMEFVLLPVSSTGSNLVRLLNFYSPLAIHSMEHLIYIFILEFAVAEGVV